jgi:hypothetical protein
MTTLSELSQRDISGFVVIIRHLTPTLVILESHSPIPSPKFSVACTIVHIHSHLATSGHLIESYSVIKLASRKNPVLVFYVGRQLCGREWLYPSRPNSFLVVIRLTRTVSYKLSGVPFRLFPLPHPPPQLGIFVELLISRPKAHNH